jgi:hypothetical protein
MGLSTAERSRRYKEAHPERCKEARRKWYAKNREKAIAYTKEWQTQNYDHYITYTKQWNKDHPERRRESMKKIYATPKGKLNHIMASSIGHSLKNRSKAGRHWESLVNYTVDSLKAHIEKQFKPGMTWENYGTVWHIDHKTPLAAFHFERPDDIDFHLCWSLKNLQPLDAKENMSKKDKLDRPFQPSLAMAI